MAHNPANIARGYLSGVQAGELSKARGLNVEKVQREMRAKASQKRKQERISGLLGDVVGGDKTAASELARQGIEGVQALSVGAGYLRGQRQDQAAEDKATQEAAAKGLVDAIPFALNVTDEQEWNNDAFPFIADKFVQAGGDPALVRKLDVMPMKEAQGIMSQMWSDSKPDTFQSTAGKQFSDRQRLISEFGEGSDEVKRFDVATAKGQGFSVTLADGTQIQVGGTDALGRQQQLRRDKLKENLNSRASAVEVFGRSASTLSKILDASPDANTFIAKAASFGAELINEVEALARQSGIKIDIPLDIESHKDLFSDFGLAGKSPIVKRLFLGLAINYALASGLAAPGRFTNDDLKKGFLAVGADINRPGVIRENLTRQFDNLSFAVTNEAQRQGVKIPSIKQFDPTTDDEKKDSDKKVEDMSIEELEELEALLKGQ